jgi:GTP pyrophosphokinase
MKYDQALFEKALIFAVNAHKGQKRKNGGIPYITHPMAVLLILIEFKETKNLYLLAIAALLHDVVEDCNVSLKTIARLFGYKVAAIIEELTNDEEYKGTKAEYLSAKMLTMSSYALVIKLCDRLHNIRTLKGLAENKIKDKKQETIHILTELARGRKLTRTQESLFGAI